MDDVTTGMPAQFDRLLDVWSGGDPSQLADVVTADYAGHMLHLAAGDRTAAEYAPRIRAYREANPGTVFRVVDQAASGDRLWSRVEALRGDGRRAHGMNVSRFVDGRIAEEWAVWSDWHD